MYNKLTSFGFELSITLHYTGFLFTTTWWQLLGYWKFKTGNKLLFIWNVFFRLLSQRIQKRDCFSSVSNY